jgi:hypothetical protein
MVDTVHTLFGSFNKEQLKSLKGNIDEIVLLRGKIKSQQQSENDILTMIHDELKIPKKIVKRLVKIELNKSLPAEVAEFKEIEALYEGITGTTGTK